MQVSGSLAGVGLRGVIFLATDACADSVPAILFYRRPSR